MSKKSKLAQLLHTIYTIDDDFGGSFKAFQDEVKIISNKIKDIRDARTIRSSLEEIKKASNVLEQGITEQENKFSSEQEQIVNKIGALQRDIELFKEKIADTIDVDTKVKETESSLRNAVVSLETRLETKIGQELGVKLEKSDLRFITEEIEGLKVKILQVRSTGHGGGNANRNILVGGNASTLSRYTDLDIQASSNITLAVSNNDTTKTTRLTISATAATITVSSFLTIAGAQSVLLGSIPTTIISVDVNGQNLYVPADDYNTSGSILNLLNTNTPVSVYGKIIYT